MKKVEEKCFVDPEEYLSALIDVGRPGNEISYTKIFCRGQGSSQWELVPKILRPDTLLLNRKTFLNKIVKSESIKTELDLRLCELYFVKRFLRISDDIGLHIPNDSLDFRCELHEFEEYFQSASQSLVDTAIDSHTFWPTNQILTVFALMQHHGLPTRLLDWTKSPLYAAYFACKQVVDNDLKDGSMAVFVIDAFRFIVWEKYPKNITTEMTDRLSFSVRPPTAGNLNLVSQQGIFSFDYRSISGDISDRSHDKAACGIEDGVGRLSVKFIFPHSKVRDLLFLLNQMGINNASLFQDWNGVANTVLESLEIIGIE